MIVIKKSRNVSRTTSAGAISTDNKERFWKRVLIVDDEVDITTALKMGIEHDYSTTNKRIAVHAYNDSTAALSEFESNFYDLLLTDINMPTMNGFELSKNILSIDINVKVWFMSWRNK